MKDGAAAGAGGAAAGGAGAGAGAGAGGGGIDASQLDDGGDDGEGAGAAGAAAPRTFKDAMASVRTERGARAAAGGKGPDGSASDDDGEGGEGGAVGGDLGGDGGEGGEAAETDEAFEARIAELTPEEQEGERGAREAIANGEPDPRLLVELPPLREGEEPIRFLAEDQQLADTIRHLQKQAGATGTAVRIREQAEAIRAQADEERFEVEVDPVSFMQRTMQDPRDFDALGRFFLTRPGVLDAMKPWLAGLLDAPEAVEHEAELADARMMKRRERVAPMVEARRFENTNARQCVRRAYETIDTLVPATMPEDRRSALVRYVVRDLQERQQGANVRVTDPKLVPGIVKEVLTSLGVATETKRVPTGAANGRPPAKAGARTGPSGQDLVRLDGARKRATGSGAGAGSPTPTIPKPPKGTMLTRGKDKSGKVIPSAFDHLRAAIRNIRRAP